MIFRVLLYYLYLQHYYNTNFITLCKSKVKLSRYHHADDKGEGFVLGLGTRLG
jgi:hypothetical protein